MAQDRISASRDARASITERSASRKRVSNANLARCTNTLATLRHPDDVLNGRNCPDPRPIMPRRIGKVIAIPQVGGLHYRYERFAA